ncbi:hypothetical protein D4764_01G0011200 [Takifugu flavidus]|uniref:Uncharacterized protein n=1 Tax=Takifugu flavidus TaxID=433684 RepID=A0A5C6PPB5_9TELE|nr:hypothetical protein D4764_01G0011200 [Takifugu flavidus]
MAKLQMEMDKNPMDMAKLQMEMDKNQWIWPNSKWNGQKPNGYGQTSNGNGQKPNGYGQTSNGNGQKPNGYGQNRNGHEAAVFKDYGAKSKGHGVSNGAGTGVSGGNGQIPNAKNMKGMDEVNGRTLKGGVLTPEQPTAVPNMSAIPQQGTTGRPAPGYVAGSAAPEQTGTEADIVFGVDSHSERTTPPPTKALPEVDALKSTEEPLAMGVPTVIPKEENVRSPNESGPKPLVVKGLPVGGDGATGLGHPYAQQPGYGQGGYLGAGYGKGGFRNGYNAGVQPDYASLVPAANSKSGFGGFHNSQQVFGLGPTANGNYGYGRMSYEPEPAVMGPEAPGNYVNGDVLTPVGVSVEGDHYENMGYINGQVQPEALAFAEAPTAIPSLAYPALPAHLPAESSLTPDVGLPAEVEDLPDPAGTASIPLDSEPATETPGLPQSHEQPEDDPQQLPRQIHIQQHLKLHFHNQGEFCGEQSDDAHSDLLLFLSSTGTNDGNKYDLNGFFGNSGYQSENGHQ